MAPIDPNFPCTITITIPLPTPRLAKIAQRVLSVDAELSPLVRRTIAITAPSFSSTALAPGTPLNPHNPENGGINGRGDVDTIPFNDLSVLQTTYSATTNRMLRVAVNGFMESVGVVLEVMAEHDVEL